jgi:hypothetical protein
MIGEEESTPYQLLMSVDSSIFLGQPLTTRTSRSSCRSVVANGAAWRDAASPPTRRKRWDAGPTRS